LDAECQGKVWSPPPSSNAKVTRALSAVQQARHSSNKPPLHRSNSSVSSHSVSPPTSGRASKHTSSLSMSAASMSTSDDQTTSNRQEKEAYFARLGEINQNRSADLPPSQGGRYIGFGNQPYTPSDSQGGFSTDELINDPLTALSKGWSIFSSVASTAISAAATHVAEGAKIAVEKASEITQNLNETVVQPTRETIQDPAFTDRVSGVVSSLGAAVATTSQRGLSALSEVVNNIAGPSGTGFTNGNRHGYTSLGQASSSTLFNDDSDHNDSNNEDDIYQPRIDSTATASSRLAHRTSQSQQLSTRSKRRTVEKRQSNWDDDDDWTEF
jgi:ADP-ribosylation factor GTPase-activating protein 1